MIHLDAVTEYVILAGLIGAIVWDLITWYFGLPTSSSHALIGGYAGAAIAHAGLSVIIPGGWYKTLDVRRSVTDYRIDVGICVHGDHLLDLSKLYSLFD